MVSVDEAIIIRLKKGENKFEVLVDPDKALALRTGKQVNMEDTLAYPSIYKDARKGDAVPKEDLQKAFGNTDAYSIAKKIILDGDFQFTTEQRRTLVQEKTREIANIISRRSINPQTKTPHPPERILNAMEQVGINVDPFTDPNLQVNDIVKSIKPLIPIKIESVVIQIIVPPSHAGKTFSTLKHEFESSEEKWLNDGSLQLTVTIPAGLEAELLQKIGNLTKGDFQSKIIKRMGLDE
jgi:ribosome maturation protein SDO1